LASQRLSGSRFAATPVGGEQLNPTYFAAAGEPKTIWQVPGSTHAQGLAARPEEYEQRVIDFFDRALLETSFEK
jgi:hypothetical protein